MSRKEELINRLSELYHNDSFVNELFNSAGIELENLDNIINELGNQIFFDKLTFSLEREEKALGIKPSSGAAIEDRRSMVEAKWKGSGKCDLALIQNVCKSWKKGDVEVSFVDGKIKLKFTNVFGIPSDLETLLACIDEVKPAHLAFYYVFKWLLIRDIHEVKTINEMQTLTISQFARGIE